MANTNCESCEALRQEVPSLIVNGFDDDMCQSLGNDTGLVASSGHDDCTDLNNLNDCLIGNQEEEVELYEVCDWKTFMKQFIPNLWTTLKAMICAICSIWTNIHCLYGSMKKLIDYLNATTQGTAFVRYYGQGAGQGVEWDLVEGEQHTIDLYMDADGSSTGSKEADRDYVVNIANCTNLLNFHQAGVSVFYYASDDPESLDNIRAKRAQHAAVRPLNASSELDKTNFNSFSWTTSGSVLIRKGTHIKVTGYVDHSTPIPDGDKDPVYRLHQFVMTWIPVNVENEIDEDTILSHLLRWHKQSSHTGSHPCTSCPAVPPRIILL